jgi:hypothetical protein
MLSFKWKIYACYSTEQQHTYTNYLGNYWDDYTDIDADSDGILDNPRPIDSDKDYHPLVEPFENYGVEKEEKWSFEIIAAVGIIAALLVAGSVGIG